MVTEVISPLLEEKGYQLTTKVFNDYIQPNNALANGQIDANLFQHTAYLENFRQITSYLLRHYKSANIGNGHLFEATVQLG